MIENQKFLPNETDVLVFFEQNPRKYYGIKDVSKNTNISDQKEMHEILLSLEKSNQIIRNKTMINDKPLTQWTLYEGDQPSYQVAPRFVQHSQPYGVLNNYKQELKHYDEFMNTSMGVPNYNYENFQVVVHNENNTNSKAYMDDFYVRNHDRRFNNINNSNYNNYKRFNHRNNQDVSIPRSRFDEYIKKPCPNNKTIYNKNNSYPVKPGNVKSATNMSNNCNTSTSNPSKTSVISMDIVNGKSQPVTIAKPITNTQKPQPEVKPTSQELNKQDSSDIKTDKTHTLSNNSTNDKFNNTCQLKKPNKSTSKKSNCGYDLMNALTKNPVAVLYEYAQKNGWTCEVEVLDIAGPPHKPRITVGAKLNGKAYEPVVSNNKKDGKRNAAEMVIRHLISEGSIGADQQDQKSTEQSQQQHNQQQHNQQQHNQQQYNQQQHNQQQYNQQQYNQQQYNQQQQYVTKPAINRSNSIPNMPIIHEHVTYAARQNEIVPTIDSVASLNYTVQTKLTELISDLSKSAGNLNLAGRKVVSALVLENLMTKGFEVVCMATGNKCITGDKISLQGTVVHDSHAEVAVRRCFVYFLYQQIQAQFCGTSNSMDLFEEAPLCTDNIRKPRQLKLKPHFKVHLYISTAPCGDSALFSTKDNCNASSVMQPIVVPSNAHQPVYETSNQGQLRCKIESGEGTIPLPPSRDSRQFQTLDGILRGERFKTMSCSDKIARWNFLGLQGSLLSQILAEPIFLNSILLGNLFQAGHLSRGVCCRLLKRSSGPKDYINHPHLMYTGNSDGQFNREIDKTNEHSINWIKGISQQQQQQQNPTDVEIIDGITGLPNIRFYQQSNMTYSRISKASLLHEYFKTQKLVNPEKTNFDMSYREIKDLSRSYNTKRKEMFQKFYSHKFGSWISKPAELTMFKNTFSV